MKLRLSKPVVLVALVFIPFTLTQCVVTEKELDDAIAKANSSSNAAHQELTKVKGQGKVTIMEGNRTVATCYTASPNVEETRWHKGHEQIVVKSRGNHGPATIQLFNSRTGVQEGTVKAYELANGGPKWAAGMGE